MPSRTSIGAEMPTAPGGGLRGGDRRVLQPPDVQFRPRAPAFRTDMLSTFNGMRRYPCMEQTCVPSPWSYVPGPCFDTIEPLCCCGPSLQPGPCMNCHHPEPFCPPCEPWGPPPVYITGEVPHCNQPAAVTQPYRFCVQPPLSRCYERGPPRRPTFPKALNRCPPTPPPYKPLLPLPYNPRNCPPKCNDSNDEVDSCQCEGPPCPVMDLPVPAPPTIGTGEPFISLPPPVNRQQCCTMPLVPIAPMIMPPMNSCCCAEGGAKLKFSEAPQMYMVECADYGNLDVADECADELGTDFQNDGQDGVASNENGQRYKYTSTVEDAAAQWSASNLPRHDTASTNVSNDKLTTDKGWNNTTSRGTSPVRQEQSEAAPNAANGAAALQQDNLKGILQVRSLSSLPKLGNNEFPAQVTNNSKVGKVTYRTQVNLSQQRQREVWLLRDTNQNVYVNAIAKPTRNGSKLSPNSSFKTAVKKADHVDNDVVNYLENFGMAQKAASGQTQGSRTNCKSLRNQRLKAKARFRKQTPFQRNQGPLGSLDSTPNLAIQSTFSPAVKDYSERGPSIRMRVKTPYDPNLQMTIQSQLGGQNNDLQPLPINNEGQASASTSLNAAMGRGQGKPRKRNYNEAYGRPSPAHPSAKTFSMGTRRPPI